MLRFLCAGALLASFAVLLGSCAGSGAGETRPADTPQAGAPASQFHASQYHASLLEQLRDAQRDGDWENMQRILALPRQGADAEQLSRYAVFERLMRGQRAVHEQLPVCGFRIGGSERGASLEFAMDEELRLAIVVEPAPEHEIVLLARGEGDARTLISARVAVVDLKVDGTSSRFEEPIVRTLTQDVTLRHGEPLRLPLQEPPVPGPEVLVRTVEFAGEIRPVGLRADGAEAAIQRIELQPLTLRRFPKGFATVRAAALETLKRASEQPGQHRGHIIVATWFVADRGTVAEKEAALELLIGLLRTGSPEVQTSVRSCLAELAGPSAPGARDRESWLSWWALREASRR